MVSRVKRDFIVLFVVLGMAAVLPLMVREIYLYLVRLIGIYAIMALGLNIFMGYCGQVNIGVAGFFCIGAYIPTVLQGKLGWHYLIAFPISAFVSLLVGWGMSWPLLRLRGHSMAIGTIAFAMAVYLLFERFPTITGGSDGTVVPAMTLFDQTMGNIFYYYLILVFFAVAFLICYFLANSQIGLALRAVRDNEEAAAAMGVDINHYKRLAWLVNGVLASIAGSLYAQQAGFISPDTFALSTNVLVLVMLCVGGPGTILGPVVGAAIMTILPYLLVKIQQYTLLMQGLVLFAVLRFLPDGVVGAISKRFRST